MRSPNQRRALRPKKEAEREGRYHHPCCFDHRHRPGRPLQPLLRGGCGRFGRRLGPLGDQPVGVPGALRGRARGSDRDRGGDALALGERALEGDRARGVGRQRPQAAHDLRRRLEERPAGRAAARSRGAHGPHSAPCDRAPRSKGTRGNPVLSVSNAGRHGLTPSQVLARPGPNRFLRGFGNRGSSGGVIQALTERSG